MSYRGKQLSFRGGGRLGECWENNSMLFLLFHLQLLSFAFQLPSCVLFSFSAFVWHSPVLYFAWLVPKPPLLLFLWNDTNICYIMDRTNKNITRESSDTQLQLHQWMGQPAGQTYRFLSSACRTFSRSARSLCWRFCSSSAFRFFSCWVLIIISLKLYQATASRVSTIPG